MHFDSEFYAMKIFLSKLKLSAILLFSFGVLNAQSQESYITISKGGGFTGSATVYKLHMNGDLFKGQGLGDIRFTEKSKMKNRARKKFFQRAEKLSPEAFNHPGNIYYAITYYSKGKTITITWGAEGHTPKDDIKKLYDDLFAKIMTMKFSPTK
jgi:hypothetical protein